MKKYAAIILIIVYGLLNTAGHAGLHALLGNRCCEIHPLKNSNKAESHCCQHHSKHRNKHLCHDHESDQSNPSQSHENTPQNNHESPDSSGSCQFGLYFSLWQMDCIVPPVLIEVPELNYNELISCLAPVHELYRHYDGRGPPAGNNEYYWFA